ncbi:amidophosphoribosyltransferase [Picrophilus oshimae]|uniref:Amidophosphoribosyltransferase n=1 Tax=Picrophilus torridus (strain ATCC 700027 / DSM 9790 / JCM 10055 / NBRC 100828 / KAW 2/3) TaxID=1122961 RepID=A0A8G2FVU8_PICTO|nr:amidophosphoribosyltransferase [Picrophilus oshimae]SMD30440.1 amidophosphoribosyltransferase [Picrophilus oshimae DSM 9789]
MDSQPQESDITTGQKVNEDCAVIGFSGDGVYSSIIAGLRSLQHRGQESSGIITYDGKIHVKKGMGLVSEVFKNADPMPGIVGIGHNRYSTSGSKGIENAGPFVISCSLGYIGITHNGEITNEHELREELKHDGYIFTSSSDTEVMLIEFVKEISRYGINEGIKRGMERLKGAYAAVLMINDRLYAIRDKFGFRPLVLGRTFNGYIIASETCAIDALSGETIKNVEPGEVIEVFNNSYKTIFKLDGDVSHCMFEYVYFARPDSIIDNIEVFQARVRMGMRLAVESPVDADVVVPVPDSGRAQALGFSKATGIPYSEGLIKNRYSERTFIMPDQKSRLAAIKIKLNAIKSEISNKRIVLVDDSIVRGNTMKYIVKIVRDAGASEVHVRISSPPITAPCFYGVDMKTKNEFIAANKTIESIKNEIGADSLAYLSIDGLKQAIGIKSICISCLTGIYPEYVPLS